MSALPPKADIGTQSRNVCFVPKADIHDLVGHLVGAFKNIMWDAQANGFGGPQIDDQLKFRGLFDGKVPGMRALSDPVDVSSGAAEKIRYAHTVAHKASVPHVIRCVIHCRDTAFYGDVCHQCSIGEEMRTGHHQNSTSMASIAALNAVSISCGPNISRT